jgi:hypothetical protein
MSQEVLSLIEHGRRALIELLGVFDEILIRHGIMKERTVPSKEDRQLLKQLKNKQ